MYFLIGLMWRYLDTFGYIVYLQRVSSLQSARGFSNTGKQVQQITLLFCQTRRINNNIVILSDKENKIRGSMKTFFLKYFCNIHGLNLGWYGLSVEVFCYNCACSFCAILCLVSISLFTVLTICQKCVVCLLYLFICLNHVY